MVSAQALTTSPKENQMPVKSTKSPTLAPRNATSAAMLRRVLIEWQREKSQHEDGNARWPDPGRNDRGSVHPGSASAGSARHSLETQKIHPNLHGWRRHPDRKS